MPGITIKKKNNKKGEKVDLAQAVAAFKAENTLKLGKSLVRKTKK